ncbi:MAG: ribonuclease P protein component [Chromatiales bacterium]|nr:ribonuclease P protein component [Chromatiales bacterium]
MAGSPAGFPRTSRLTRPGQFKRVFADPLRTSDDCLTLLARPNGLDQPRLGLAIAKKHVRLAHDRNRLKRQIREFFRVHRLEYPAVDLVILARHGIHAKSNEQIRRSLQTHLNRLRKQCANS